MDQRSEYKCIWPKYYHMISHTCMLSFSLHASTQTFSLHASTQTHTIQMQNLLKVDTNPWFCGFTLKHSLLKWHWNKSYTVCNLDQVFQTLVIKCNWGVARWLAKKDFPYICIQAFKSNCSNEKCLSSKLIQTIFTYRVYFGNLKVKRCHIEVKMGLNLVKKWKFFRFLLVTYNHCFHTISVTYFCAHVGLLSVEI